MQRARAAGSASGPLGAVRAGSGATAAEPAAAGAEDAASLGAADADAAAAGACAGAAGAAEDASAPPAVSAPKFLAASGTVSGTAAWRTTVVDPTLLAAVRVALDAAGVSGGLVDPTVGRALAAVGYDRDIAAVPADDPAPIRPVPAAGWRSVVVDEALGAVRLPAGRRYAYPARKFGPLSVG